MQWYVWQVYGMKVTGSTPGTADFFFAFFFEKYYKSKKLKKNHNFLTIHRIDPKPVSIDRARRPSSVKNLKTVNFTKNRKFSAHIPT